MDELTLSKRTKEIIANFSQMNKSMWFIPGQDLQTIGMTKDLLGYAKIAETIPQEFGIYDLSRFLSILSIYKEPTIQLKDNSLIIKNGTDKSYNYYYCEKEMILLPLPNKPHIKEVILCFELNAKDLTDLIKITSISKHPEIAIISKDNKTSIQAVDEKGAIKDKYKNIIGTSSDGINFEAHFKSEKFSYLLPGTYMVTIALGKLGDGEELYLCQFTSNDVEYFIAAEEETSRF